MEIHIECLTLCLFKVVTGNDEMYGEKIRTFLNDAYSCIDSLRQLSFLCCIGYNVREPDHLVFWL